MIDACAYGEFVIDRQPLKMSIKTNLRSLTSVNISHFERTIRFLLVLIQYFDLVS